MATEKSQTARYEEYAYVLDFETMGRSTTVRGRGGIIITALGEGRLTLLELLGAPNSSFDVGERVYIGREGRTKILSVLGKMDYQKISNSARSELPSVISSLVESNEGRFIDYLNNARPLTPRIHMLELIPGIGKTYLKIMLEERERAKFSSFDDLQERVGIKEPVKHLSQRILDEIGGDMRMNLFVKR